MTNIVVTVECIFTWYWLSDLFGSNHYMLLSISTPSTLKKIFFRFHAFSQNGFL
jgi:hypothetical protein